MNYFQLYETERKHLKVGARWICVNPSIIYVNPGIIISKTLNEIVEIIDIYTEIIDIYTHDYIKFKVLSGDYKNMEYTINKQWFIKGYKLYTGEIPTQEPPF